MTYRTILAVLQGEKADRHCLETAHAVARMSDGHIEAMHVRGEARAFVAYTGDAMAGGAYAQVFDAVEKEIAEKARKARAAFDAWVRETGIVTASAPAAGTQVSVAWVEKTGAEDRIVGRDGRLCDIIVLPSSAGQQDVRGEQTIERAMFESGRPVLIVPREKPLERFDRIAIFWNGSKEAVRAVDGAMPLLRQAKAVDVMWAEEDVEPDDVQNGLVGYLGWHGIAASAKRFQPDSRFIGELLMDEAAKARTDLVVMGGYSHSRLREFILGGVTQHMLESATLPVLAAH